MILLMVSMDTCPLPVQLRWPEVTIGGVRGSRLREHARRHVAGLSLTFRRRWRGFGDGAVPGT